MKKVIPFMLVSLLSVSFLQASKIPPVMGDWQGAWATEPASRSAVNSPELAAQVVGIGNDTYLVQIMEAFGRRADLYFEAPIKADKDGRLVYEDDKWSFVISADSFAGQSSHGHPEPIPFSLKKIQRLSPTLGRPAPTGAVVLFDGKNLDAWQHADQQAATWLVLDEEKAFECLPRTPENGAGGNLFTRRTFGDCEIHLEYLIPYLPEDRVKWRGNSGVYIQGLYEIQIIDSYGATGGWQDCGALYKVSPPKVNMSGPPGQWQSYDIIFRTARFNASGDLIQYPVISVSHNGVPIHTLYGIKERTSHALSDRLLPPPSDPGVILLQDHGYRVQFRNVWVRPLD